MLSDTLYFTVPKISNLLTYVGNERYKVALDRRLKERGVPSMDTIIRSPGNLTGEILIELSSVGFLTKNVAEHLAEKIGSPIPEPSPAEFQ